MRAGEAGRVRMGRDTQHWTGGERGCKSAIGLGVGWWGGKMAGSRPAGGEIFGGNLVAVRAKGKTQLNKNRAALQPGGAGREGGKVGAGPGSRSLKASPRGGCRN